MTPVEKMRLFFRFSTLISLKNEGILVKFKISKMWNRKFHIFPVRNFLKTSFSTRASTSNYLGQVFTRPENIRSQTFHFEKILSLKVQKNRLKTHFFSAFLGLFEWKHVHRTISRAVSARKLVCARLYTCTSDSYRKKPFFFSLSEFFLFFWGCAGVLNPQPSVFSEYQPHFMVIYLCKQLRCGCKYRAGCEALPLLDALQPF